MFFYMYPQGNAHFYFKFMGNPQVEGNSRRIREEGGNRNLDKSMFFTGIRKGEFTFTVNLQVFCALFIMNN